MNEEKSLQEEPPSTAPSTPHGKQEGLQVPACNPQEPKSELLDSKSVFLNPFSIITALRSPLRYFFLIMNTTYDILIPQIYYISIYV